MITITAVLSLALLLVAGRDEYKRVITIDDSVDDSQHCLLNNTLHCSSFHYVLAHLQSGDYVNVTSNSVSLLTVVKISSVNNITIRGQGNTIVMCNNSGVVSCENCSDVVIEGIIWDQCGNSQTFGTNLYHNGGIILHTISNLTVQNCTFQHSKVRALSLIAVTGFVYVKNSYFVNNANYYTIFCSQGYKDCGIENITTTGGVLITSRNASISRGNLRIHIDSCVFSHNGYFGNVNDTTQLSRKAHKVAFSPGLSIQIIEPTFSVDIAITKSIFSFNRGANGASGVALYVHVYSINPNIALTELQVWNNSAIKFFDKVSALRVFHGNRNKNNYYKQSLLNMSSCSFYGNDGGQNMLNYAVKGGPSIVMIDNCTFLNNNYGGALVKLEMQTKVLIISNINFTANTNKGGVIYLLVNSENFTVVLLNINLERNFDSLAGGVVLRLNSNYIIHSIIRAYKLNFTNNQFIGNDGIISILGTFRETCIISIEDCYFNNNFGLSHGSVIHSSLTCEKDKTYFISIENCIFTHNRGKSIVYIGMEHYYIPAFLVLNAEFCNNTGTPLQLFNIILVGKGVSRFQNNRADVGAALYLRKSYILLNFTSFQFDIIDNLATEYGGAIYLDILFTNSYKRQCHWLLYFNAKFCGNVDHQINGCTIPIDAKLFCKGTYKIRHSTSEAISHIYITNNTALLAGSAVFYNNMGNIFILHTSAVSLDPVSIFKIPHTFTITPDVTTPLVMATQPQMLQLADPAKCNNDYTVCNISGITLGQNIEIPASIIGYNDRTIRSHKILY